jgi:hypothetical protein
LRRGTELVHIDTDFRNQVSASVITQNRPYIIT